MDSGTCQDSRVVGNETNSTLSAKLRVDFSVRAGFAGCILGIFVTQEWPLVEEPGLELLSIVGRDQFPFYSPFSRWKQTASQ